MAREEGGRGRGRGGPQEGPRHVREVQWQWQGETAQVREWGGPRRAPGGSEEVWWRQRGPMAQAGERGYRVGTLAGLVGGWGPSGVGRSQMTMEEEKWGLRQVQGSEMMRERK